MFRFPLSHIYKKNIFLCPYRIGYQLPIFIGFCIMFLSTISKSAAKSLHKQNPLSMTKCMGHWHQCLWFVCVCVLWFSVCLLIELHAAVPGQVSAGGWFLLLLCGWWARSSSFIVSVSQQCKSPILSLEETLSHTITNTWVGKQFTCRGMSFSCRLDFW